MWRDMTAASGKSESGVSKIREHLSEAKCSSGRRDRVDGASRDVAWKDQVGGGDDDDDDDDDSTKDCNRQNR